MLVLEGRVVSSELESDDDTDWVVDEVGIVGEGVQPAHLAGTREWG